MNQSAPKNSRSKKITPLGIIFAILGILLFAYFVRKAGVGEILANIKRLGAGFIVILLISVVRKIVRAHMKKLDGVSKRAKPSSAVLKRRNCTGIQQWRKTIA